MRLAIGRKLRGEGLMPRPGRQSKSQGKCKICRIGSTLFRESSRRQNHRLNNTKTNFSMKYSAFPPEGPTDKTHLNSPVEVQSFAPALGLLGHHDPAIVLFLFLDWLACLFWLLLIGFLLLRLFLFVVFLLLVLLVLPAPPSALLLLLFLLLLGLFRFWFLLPHVFGLRLFFLGQLLFGLQLFGFELNWLRFFLFFL